MAIPRLAGLHHHNNLYSKDHNALNNLAVGDVHTHYVKLAGRAAGQTIIGGLAASEKLILQSTAHATRGQVETPDLLVQTGTLASNAGIRQAGSDTPLITKGLDPFTSGAYNGWGRWGFFMEPHVLVAGIWNTAGKYFKVRAFNADSSGVDLLSLSSIGDLLNLGYHRVGSLATPTNVTAGDLTTTRLFIGSGQDQVGGAWIVPTFNAADFTSDTGSWTVEAGDSLAYAYTLVGKTMIFSASLYPTATTGTPLELRVKIPGGKTGAKNQMAGCITMDNGVLMPAFVESLGSTTYVRVRRADNAAWTSGQGVFFTLPFEVQ